MTRSGGDFQPRQLKRLFTTNQCWTSFLDAGGLRDIGKRTARAVLTGMCYSAGSAMRHGSSSLTRLTGQSAMTPGTW
ncbi:hypothetical protein EAS69_25125 [Escherichia coli]|nr:hypothetical protein [Escherichia coli]EFO3163241.1 hypothetical protein [Escherichia coli]